MTHPSLHCRTVLLASALAISTASHAAEITLYEHANFAGAQLTLRGYTADVSSTGFNDRASSIVVTSGRWELCTDANFKGTCVTVTRGEYPVLDSSLNDRITSARETGSYGETRGSYNDYGSGAIELFDEPNFGGRSLRLDRDAATLTQSGFNDRAASVVVSKGTWELCSDADYGGTCRTYAPGRYADLGYGMARQLSSARLLRSASEAPAVMAPGLPPAAAGQAGRVVLFSERGLRGASVAISNAVPDLDRSNFNDQTASFIVESGSWVACRDSHFRGDCRVFGPGRYEDLTRAGFDRVISSIRPGSDAPVTPQGNRQQESANANGGIELYSEPGFAGERLQVERNMGNLDRVNFDHRAASAVVVGGTWELCTEARFEGNCAVYRPGRYPRLGGLTRQISSARRIQ